MMRAQSMLVLVALAALAGAFGGASAGDFLEDLQEFAQKPAEQQRVFDEQTAGFDSRDDKFYFQDNLVSELYARKKFLNGLITLGGQNDDAVNLRAKPSSFAFGVAQRTSKSSGELMDRWDSKDVGGGKLQLFAVYHGEGSSFVVNKLRAHLLRKLANMIQEFVPALDRAVQQDAAAYEDERNEVYQTVIDSITETFSEVDQSIRLAMKDNSDDAASATVLIVTEQALVSASVGGGRVLGYQESSLFEDLTSQGPDDARNMFGARKRRPNALCKPQVKIFARKLDDQPQENNYQLVVIESPNVATRISDYELFRVVLSEVNQHKLNKDNEQHIYSSSIARILEMTKNSAQGGNFFAKLVNSQPDDTVMLIGLERDYERIH